MQLPEIGFLRLSQIVGDSKATPPIPAIFPFSKSTWWRGVKDGKFPKPIKFGLYTTAWRVEDIKKLIASMAGEQEISQPSANVRAVIEAKRKNVAKRAALAEGGAR